MGGSVGHHGWMRAGLGAGVLCAALAAHAAPASVAPACAAALTQPSWADCAAALSGRDRFDSAIDDPFDGDLAGAPQASIDLTRLDVNVQGDGNGASQAPVGTPSTVAAIPEPHTNLLMLAGLAAIAFMATRRRRP
jgi:PEP-CTERM motif